MVMEANRMTRAILGLTAAAALSLSVSGANATLFIGLQQDAGPIVTVATGSTLAVPTTFAGSFR